MKEAAEYLLNPLTDGWLVLKTTKSYYSIRFGGVKREAIVQEKEYDIVHLPFDNKMIEHIYTDDEWVYVIFQGDDVISFGLINPYDLGFYFKKRSDYDLDYFTTPDMVEFLM